MEAPPDDNHYSRLQEILHLPPLPGVACQLLKEVTREETDLGHLTRLIEQDPGLAARIVGIANSAYFARQREIHSVEDAIVRVLGLNIVRGLAIGIALSKPFDVSVCPEFEFERYWYRAFVSANLAAAVAPYLDLEPELQNCMFLSGLLHNLGQLVLVHAFPGRMSEIFRQKLARPNQSLLEQEAQILAMTEIQAGAFVAKRWKLPRCITHTIQYRHNANLAGKYEVAVEAVALCARIAETVYDEPDGRLVKVSDFGPSPATLTPDILNDLVEKTRQRDEQYRMLASTLAVQE